MSSQYGTGAVWQAYKSQWENNTGDFATFGLGKAGATPGGGSGTSGGAAGAVGQAIQVQAAGPIGGGSGAEVGAQETQTVIAERSDEWNGIDTFSPDTKISANHSPFAVNWDSVRKFGSRCKRMGMMQLKDNLPVLGLNSAYRGLSLVACQNNGTKPMFTMATYCDADIGASPAAVNTALYWNTQRILWSKPFSAENQPGPVLALTQETGPFVRATISMAHVFGTATGLLTISFPFLTVLMIGPTTTESFPFDPDMNTDSRDLELPAGATLHVLARRTAYTTQVDSTPPLAVGKYWVAAWWHNFEGTSERSIASLTVT